ncbi:hypothetical protein [Nocardia terpenica]
MAGGVDHPGLRHGTTVPAIARLAAADEDTVREVPATARRS